MTLRPQNVLCLPENRVGRDFVIGDVDGGFDRIFAAMRGVHFEPNRDRLFSVGHLLHSDTSPSECVRFLRHPSVFAVRTNSEQELIDLFDDGEPDGESIEAVAQAGFSCMAWLASAGAAQQLQVVDTMRMLPLAITVGERGAVSGFVHAAVPSMASWAEFGHGLQSGNEECIQAALFGVEEQAGTVGGVRTVFVCYGPDWDLRNDSGNTAVVLPGNSLRLLGMARAGHRSIEKGAT